MCAGRCYHRGADRGPYTAAEAYCAAKAAHLATPRSGAENTCVQAVGGGGDSAGWLGYSGGTSDSDPHRGADDGTPVGPYTSWASSGITYKYDYCVDTYNGLWYDNSLRCEEDNTYPLCQLRDCDRPQCPDATPEV